jgi:hypothetical protein
MTTFTTQARQLLDDTSFAAMLTTLGAYPIAGGSGSPITGQLWVTSGTSTASSSLLILRPTDYGTGKPQFSIFKHATANRYNLQLFDGVDNAGTINIACSNFTLNDNPIPSVILGVLSVPATNASGSGIKLFEDTDNGGNFVGLYAPNALAADLFFKLPATDGSAGQAMVTDGSGNLSFGNAAGGGAYEFVGNFTASAATSLVITSGFHADYDEYVFNIRNMVTSTSTFMTLQVYEDGGTTPIGGTAYSSGGSVTTNGTSYWRFHATAQAATSLSIGEVKLLRCSTTLTGMLSQTVQRTSTGSALPATQHGHVVTTAKINAVRWSVNSGNITIDVDMYRIKSV